MNHTVSDAKIRQKMNAVDEHYHAEKLGLGGHGAHEGWIHAEEADMNVKNAVNLDTRQEMIAVAAYYLAEKRGFAGHESLHDWIKAEAEIKSRRVD